MATVPGIDVSYWNSGIDWPKVRATGQRFVFPKATEGDFYADPTFAANWSGAKSAGLLRGAYHFFRANVDGKKQAKKFIDYVKKSKDDGELPHVLDLETQDGQNNARIIARAKDWLDEVEAAFGKKPVIYSGMYFLQDYFSEAGGGPPKWAKDYPLWLAQYPNQYVPGMRPFLPKIEALADLPLTWHFVGRIQGNKTAAIAAGFAWVHGIDRLRIAQRLDEQRPAGLPPLDCCIEVNLCGEASKGGAAPQELPARDPARAGREAGEARPAAD